MKGIVTGYDDGTFRPDRQVNRMEFTAMLMCALNPDSSEQEHENTELAFADASGIPAWTRSSVAKATQLGLIQGFADGTLRPGKLMSRTEMAMVAARALHLPEVAGIELPYADASDIPAWARGAVAAVLMLRIMNQSGQTAD